MSGLTLSENSLLLLKSGDQIMRTYYIFFQQYKLINADEFCPDYPFEPQYKLLPWEYYGYVIGTRDLYEIFKHITGYHYGTKCLWIDSFEYNPDTPVQKTESFRGIIVDDAGNVRDFYELTIKYHNYNYFRKIPGKHHKAYHYHCFSNANEKRQSLTPQELNEIRHTTCIHVPNLPPDRKMSGWESERCTVTGGSWKDQSKKQKQYGEHSEKLSKIQFEEELKTLDDLGCIAV